MSVPFPFLADGIKITVNAAPGTGNITLGSAVPGFQSFIGAGVRRPARGDFIPRGGSPSGRLLILETLRRLEAST
jgi:hypothetical protein